jgi:hypothetical protein
MGDDAETPIERHTVSPTRYLYDRHSVRIRSGLVEAQLKRSVDDRKGLR